MGHGLPRPGAAAPPRGPARDVRPDRLRASARRGRRRAGRAAARGVPDHRGLDRPALRRGRPPVLGLRPEPGPRGLRPGPVEHDPGAVLSLLAGRRRQPAVGALRSAAPAARRLLSRAPDAAHPARRPVDHARARGHPGLLAGARALPRLGPRAAVRGPLPPLSAHPRGQPLRLPSGGAGVPAVPLRAVLHGEVAVGPDALLPRARGAPQGEHAHRRRGDRDLSAGDRAAADPRRGHGAGLRPVVLRRLRVDHPGLRAAVRRLQIRRPLHPARAHSFRHLPRPVPQP